MKKIFIIVCTACLQIGGAAAQSGGRSAGFQVGIVPGVSTNGRDAKEYSNGASFNLLVGESRNERAFTFAGLGNIIHRDAAGLQFAGLFNYVGRNAEGVQFGGLANYIRGNTKGLSFSGLGNVTKGSHSGVQYAGLANTAGNLQGMQFAGLANLTGNLSGVQFGGLVNLAGNTSGVQIGGLANAAGNIAGMQFAGLVNSAGNMHGVQLAGLVNAAGNVQGMQFAGLVNVAKEVRGVQFAGLVNVARRSDVPIGLVNIIREGEMAVGLTYNELGSASVDFRSGSHVSYGIVGVGYNHTVSKPVLRGGYGFHIQCTRWLRIDQELTVETVGAFSDEPAVKSGYALLPSFRVAKRLEIFGGPSVNYLYSKYEKYHDLFPNHSLWKRAGDQKMQQVYIGWQAGLKFRIK